MGQMYPQKTLPIMGTNKRTIAAGIKESKRILELTALMSTSPGSICKNRSRFVIDIPATDASVNRSKKRPRQIVWVKRLNEIIRLLFL